MSQWTKSLNPRAEDRVRHPSSSMRQENGGKFLLSLRFVCLDFQGTGYVQPHWRGQSTDSTNSNANPIWKLPYRHTQKQCLIWASHSPPKLTHKINHHTSKGKKRYIVTHRGAKIRTAVDFLSETMQTKGNKLASTKC